jgi:hypothetical protein
LLERQDLILEIIDLLAELVRGIVNRYFHASVFDREAARVDYLTDRRPQLP